MRNLTGLVGLACLWMLPAAAGADEAAAFFDDTKVQEIRIYFDNPDWYNVLYQSHDRDRLDPYFPARIKSGDVEIPVIGARFKGNSSFRRNGVKKPFKLDFNWHDDDATFFGLKKLNLHNGDIQPDFMHEKLFLEYAGKHIPAMRAVYVRLYVNDVYYGLYLAVEQPDKTMMRSRFGSDEDGNLWEAGESVVATMEYLGSNPATYYTRYELKTNETANDYSALIELLDVLNNTPAAELPERLEPLMDVENVVQGMALNALYVNLDSYVGTASEYFLYRRSSDNRFVHIHWDTNETFGSTGDGTPRLANPFTMHPFYLPPAGGGTARRPLLEKLWAVPQYRRLYLQCLARFMREGFDEESIRVRSQELANLVRPHYAEDPNKVFSMAQFEAALTNQVTANGFTTYGLTQFTRERSNYLKGYLAGRGEAADIRLNELMTVNTTPNRDDAGEADPWVELQNMGPAEASTAGMTLSDDPENPAKWALPATAISDGGRMIIWVDGEAGEGSAHANFRLSEGGGKLFLYAGGTLVDSVSYGALPAGQAYARMGMFGSSWSVTATPTYAAANVVRAPANAPGPVQPAVALFVNELMADNDGSFEDPDEAGSFEDWFELFNAGIEEIDLGGMYITDNPNNPKKWQVPAGVKIAAGGYLVFIADGETEQGPLHTSWSLSKSGESISLYAADGTTLIDRVVFGAQETDVSFGRTTDGGPDWSLFTAPTPGTSNAAPVANWIVSAASLEARSLAPGSKARALVSGLVMAEGHSQANPLPEELGGVQVTVARAGEAAKAAGLSAVTMDFVEFQVPEDLRPGRATVTITGADRSQWQGAVIIESASPGLYSADGTGGGIGLIAVIHRDSSGNERWSWAAEAGAAVPVTLGPEGTEVSLVVYGTGFGTSPAGVTAQVGGANTAVVSVERNPEYAGLDEIRLGPLSRTLAGAGMVAVTVSVGARTANVVTVAIE
jgi:uncharacterized protein (TIGR03437 family)